MNSGVSKCRKWRDRDVVAVMNISHRGWLRFRQSKGEAGEAMVQEPREDEVLLKVDASKLSQCSRVLAFTCTRRRLDRTYVFATTTAAGYEKVSLC